MKRKVIKQANQAYTITLPVAWARENNLDKNSEIDLSTEGNTLIIQTNAKTEGEIVELEIKTLNQREIRMQIAALYARGVDEIRITSKKDISDDLMKITSSLLGFALVSKEKDIYIIKDMSGKSDMDLDEIFKRVFQMILIFYEDAISDISTKRKAKEKCIRLRDGEVNKFCNYLERSINKKAYSKDLDARILFTYAFSLEKIGDEIYRLWTNGIKNKIGITPQIQKIFQWTKESLEKSFDLYYQFKTERVLEITNLKHIIREEEAKNKRVDLIQSKTIRQLLKITEEAADLTHLTLMKKL